MNVLSLLAATEEVARPMYLPTFVFAIIAASFFLVLAIVTLSFRDVANRHSQKWADNHGDSHGDNSTHH